MLNILTYIFLTMSPVTTPCTAHWNPAQVYVKDNLASVDNVNYKANWWTQGDNPSTQSGPVNSGKPWLVDGPCINVADANKPTAPIVTPVSPSPGKLPEPSRTSLFYSAYKDVAISANWNTSVISTAVTGSMVPLVSLNATIPAITWSFATGECGNENWGGLSANTLASANVQSFVNNKKPYMISTGGASGQFTCGTDAGFTAFIERYYSTYLKGIDFDIEAGQSTAAVDALVQRVMTAQKNPKYAPLRFSFTIATLGGNAPQSLGTAGVMVMNAIQKAGLKNYYINLMTMDYGSSTPTNCTQNADGSCAMGLSAVQAAINLNKTYKVPFNQIEVTPMIGGNDTIDETFSLTDVDVVTSFAKKYSLAGVHYWSLDRDKDCAPGYASPTCNTYGKSGTLGFAQRFANGLK